MLEDQSAPDTEVGATNLGCVPDGAVLTAPVDQSKLFSIGWSQETERARLVRKANGELIQQRLHLHYDGSGSRREWRPEPVHQEEAAPGTIHKYEIKQVGANRLSMPYCAQILSVQMQGPRLVLWALVDPDEEPVVRLIEAHPTGERVQNPQELLFLATVQIPNIGLVYHVFERLCPVDEP